jgi:hypothetical protein
MEAIRSSPVVLAGGGRVSSAGSGCGEASEVLQAGTRRPAPDITHDGGEDAAEILQLGGRLSPKEREWGGPARRRERGAARRRRRERGRRQLDLGPLGFHGDCQEFIQSTQSTTS